VWQFTSTGSVRGIEGNVDKNKLDVPIGRIKAR
jgi:GH25 family lysozyme M1 (1,4-beta-N-acetylmuramidase)